MFRNTVPGRARASRSSSASPRSLPASRRRAAEVRPEILEQRTLFAAFVVTELGDSGPGTLRQAILDANTLTGADTITFNIPGNDVYHTIRPLSQLPDVTGQTTIDGKTRATQVIELDGSLAGPGANGLVVVGSNSVVRGLVINRFAGHGVVTGILGPGPRTSPLPIGISVEGNFIGTDVTGNLDLGNGGAGVVVASDRTGVGGQFFSPASSARNVISGNGFAGVWVTAGGLTVSSVRATISGNYIGTNAAGTRALGNDRDGILVDGGSGTSIGSPVARGNNVISGNAGSGIRIAGNASNLLIQNNSIGTDFAGARAVPNGWSAALPFHDGITIAATGNPTFIGIGGNTPTTTSSSVRNLISGNVGAGVNVLSGGEVHVIGNYIGTDATGNSDVGNGGDGVAFQGNGVNTTISTAFGRVSGNLVSGNGGDGVRVTGARLAVPIGGNYIGTNATGTAPLGNDGNGITFDSLQNSTGIGSVGAVPAPSPTPTPINPGGTARNLISANGGHGIFISNSTVRIATVPVTIVNNYVGTDVTGTVPLGNGGSGVYVATGYVTVGSTAYTNGGNLISANGGNGITITGLSPTAPTSPANNQILGNRIGVAAPETRVPPTFPDPGANVGLGNHGHGIAVFNVSGNRIGSGERSGANVIAYNDRSGVLVEGPAGQTPSPAASSASTLITGNSIYGNGGLGIDLSLSGEGVTPNDTLDADTGPNGLQNTPTITEATLTATGTTVQIRFTLFSERGRSYRVEFFANPLPDPSGNGEGRTFLGVATVTTDASGGGSGTFSAPVPAGAGAYFTATATSNNVVTSEFSPAVLGTAAQPPRVQGTQVVQRQLFYNNSAYDGDDPAVNTLDGAAVATDKAALLPGQTASFANVTSYSKGINGLQLMLFSATLAHPALGASDFEFAVSATGGDWAPAPAPSAVTLIPVPGPNTLYHLTWPDGAVRNTWLRVTVKANANTGLDSPDVFYFGNLVGETGDAGTPLRVSAQDMAGTKGHAATEGATLTSHYDHNRDGRVNAQDLAAVRVGYNGAISSFVAPPPLPQAPAAGTDQDETVAAQVLG